jgi:hydrogenase maturation protein HypF
MSQYIGDLKNFESMAFYEEIFERYTQMFRFKPELIVHDLHPDYLSTKFAIELSERLGGIPLLPVQHHFAHITSVMLAKGIEERVIGFSMDGLGLGSDGKIWGAEIMLVGYEGFERLFHFEYMPLPGGDIANKEPWRMALSYLLHAFNGNFDSLNLTLLDAIDKDKISKIQKLIANSFNSPLISSAGRLFDAVSAILGLNYISTYQAEAPMLLESIADMTVEDFYDYKVSGDEIIFADMIKGIVDDHVSGISNSIISGKFHNTLVKLMLDLAIQIRTTHQINHVVLSGGTFQNRKLSEKLIRKLEAESFSVALPGIIPVNDQGIALGQMAIGAAKRIKK